ncbi:ATP-binding protein [Streptomyces sp. NBC_01336]|uniref:ATP-binding protein n=1 Tax=Streptomyces sp. NBC_01336 TaxID=2903829 RepID=UPI002E1482DD|nr:ATP-binding protein [Streptomyces sp. NBC_01336]
MPFTVDLVAVPKAVPVVRRMLRARFAGADTTDLTLCVGELLTNVIVHLGEGAPVTLRVSGTHTGLIRAELSDPVPGVWPVHRSAGAGDESGRGLLLVDALALRWGVERGLHGKTVWCELRAPLRSGPRLRVLGIECDVGVADEAGVTAGACEGDHATLNSFMSKRIGRIRSGP